MRSLDTNDCEIYACPLLCGEETIRTRLQGDIDKGLRTPDVLGRSLERIPFYDSLNTIKIDTDNKTVLEICNTIIPLTDTATSKENSYV